MKMFLGASLLGLMAVLNAATVGVFAAENPAKGIVDCFYEQNSLACAKKWADAELDRIEVQITGKQSSMTFSKVLEEAGALVVDGTKSLLGEVEEKPDELSEPEESSQEAETQVGEARGKHKLKKKKKILLKFIPIIMMFKAKLSLLLQLVSTHFQLKFFAIAIVSLLINVARFWIDIKNSHQHPAKVVYYEHAQHQHHYDHDDEHGGYWKRSADSESPHQMAYSAYAPQR